MAGEIPAKIKLPIKDTRQNGNNNWSDTFWK